MLWLEEHPYSYPLARPSIIHQNNRAAIFERDHVTPAREAGLLAPGRGSQWAAGVAPPISSRLRLLPPPTRPLRRSRAGRGEGRVSCGRAGRGAAWYRGDCAGVTGAAGWVQVGSWADSTSVRGRRPQARRRR